MNEKKPRSKTLEISHPTPQENSASVVAIERELFPESSFKACLLVIGNEILTGRTQDLNVQFMGEILSRHGVDLKEVRIIPDVETDIIKNLKELKELYDYVFTTGGIGPTHDDLTTECVAQAFGVPVIEDEEALHRLQAYYGETLNATNRKMARVPFGSRLIENPITGAPGFFIENIYVLAGVPRIMRAMMMSILPTLKGGPPILSQSVSCRIGESHLAEDLRKLQERYPTFDIGIYPFSHPEGYGTTIVVRGKSSKTVERIIGKIKKIIEDHGGLPESNVNLLFEAPKSKSSFLNSWKDTQEGSLFLKETFLLLQNLNQEKKKILYGGMGVFLALTILGAVALWGLTSSPEPRYVQKPFLQSVDS